MKKVLYSQDAQWMHVTYGEHMGIKCKIPINQDSLSDEEESDEEDDPIQLQTDDTKLNEQEKKEIFKDEAEMPPGEAQNLEWMANTHPGTENNVGIPEVKT